MMKGIVNMLKKNAYNKKIKMIMGIASIMVIAYVSELSVTNQAIMQKLVWIVFAILGGIVFACNCKSERVREDFLFANMLYIPFVVASIYTVILMLIKGHDTMGVALKACSTTSYLIIDMIAAFFLAYFFRKKVISILFYSVTFSYVLSLIIALKDIGFLEIYNYLFDNSIVYVSYFEKNDVGVAVVPLIIYYLYTLIIQKEKIDENRFVKLAVLFIILIFCGKRSAYMGLLLSVVFMIVYRILEKYRSKLIFTSLLLVFVGAFLYVILIKIGVLVNILQMMGINSMGRLEVYSWFSNQYELSPLYMGKGFQYVHRYMMNGMGNQLVNDYGYLHNSILQIYIETGFVGFFAWFGYILLFYSTKLKKCYGEKAYVLYALLMIAMVCMFSVDNVLTYPLFQLTINTVLLQFIYTRESKKGVKEDEKCNCDIEL